LLGLAVCALVLLSLQALLSGYVMLRQVRELSQRRARRDLHLDRARGYLAQGKHALASVGFRRASAALSADPQVERGGQKLHLHSVVHSREVLRGDELLSTEYLSRLWLEGPGSSTLSASARALAAAALCRVHQSAGALEEAIGQCRAAAQAAPDDPQVHFLLALLYQAQEDLDGTRRELLEATRIDPKHYMARLELAVLDLADPKPDLERVEGKLRDLRTEEAHPLTNYYLGTLLVRRGEFPEAAAALKAARSLQDKVPGFRTTFGAALLQAGDVAGGREELTQAYNRHRDPVALLHLGTSFRRAGELDRARDTLLRAVGAQPDLLAAYPELAEVAAEQGKASDARRHLQTYIDRASKQRGMEQQLERARARLDALRPVPASALPQP